MDKESLAVGWFLAVRQIKRANPWTTLLIIMVMMLTFLNLVVVSGILIGLVEGSSFAYRSQYSGDVLVSNLATKTSIPNTANLVKNITSASPHISSYSVRYITGAIAESDYKKVKKPGDSFEKINTSFVGINPQMENAVTELSKRIVEGEYLADDDDEYVLVGSSLVKEYAGRSRPGGTFLSNIKPGNKIKLTVKDKEKEYTIKGIIKSKIGEVGGRVYGIDREVRKIAERFDNNANEISFKIDGSATPEKVKREILSIKQLNESESQANVQTWEEAQGQFFKDVQSTFFILGSLIGLIGLIVASITLFIVVFINAFSRRRYIGILKGIGVDAAAIKISYIFQSIFYSVVGSLLGFIIVYALLVPYFHANPIDFPFSDGFLYAPIAETALRFGLLLMVTVIAGYIPAAMIAGRNTLDAILGR